MIEAFIFGFIGSFHCIGMCGPIAMALPVREHNSILNRISIVMLYNIGRVLTYAVIGLLFGLIGMGVRLAGFQQGLSIFLGIIMLVITYFTYFNRGKLFKVDILQKPLNSIRQAIGKLFRAQSALSLFGIGLLNGLLPCGFVYLGVIWTTSLGNTLHGVLFMTFFGLGTIPAMLGVSLMSNLFNLSLRNKINKVIPVFMLVVGILLIVRGLNLGIPFISPHIENLQTASPTNCH
ncbi:sulfite exporter TauE/SafE family protein [Solitalea lacus]|uniref:sulfite exporter TauE/SafE family protein n=1 Tax=Solitalea lacus TaxID=2911172 RepID=UPI001EDA0520|nr:sulfite exporter TauE/SafE family protein [Solitalea lacus]UKJ05926.1 sulfite exporter TauE/SafE family protein [Solitalea lacus]